MHRVPGLFVHEVEVENLSTTVVENSRLSMVLHVLLKTYPHQLRISLTVEGLCV
jgi:hypothetical protein